MNKKEQMVRVLHGLAELCTTMSYALRDLSHLLEQEGEEE